MRIVAHWSSIRTPKNLYVEHEVAHLDTRVDGTIEMQTATMDIADYLKQAGQTAGHRELWRLLRTLFEETNDRRGDERHKEMPAGFNSPSGIPICHS